MKANLGKVGGFEVIRELGRGGMGVVYEARQVSLNRRVALKVLNGGLGLTTKAVGRFKREAEAAAKLHHTNIVPIYATGEEDGTHFYAMELIGGCPLDKLIKQTRDGGLQKNIGQQLHVATVLEGSVSQSGKNLRISAQLISIADGFHLWATNYALAQVGLADCYALLPGYASIPNKEALPKTRAAALTAPKRECGIDPP